MKYKGTLLVMVTTQNFFYLWVNFIVFIHVLSFLTHHLSLPLKLCIFKLRNLLGEWDMKKQIGALYLLRLHYPMHYAKLLNWQLNWVMVTLLVQLIICSFRWLGQVIVSHWVSDIWNLVLKPNFSVKYKFYICNIVQQ